MPEALADLTQGQPLEAAVQDQLPLVLRQRGDGFAEAAEFLVPGDASAHRRDRVGDPCERVRLSVLAARPDPAELVRAA